LGFVNYHTHTKFCDGTSEPEEYVRAAIDLGFDALGFSGHAPVPFVNRWSIKPEMLDDYVSIILLLKEKYHRQIEIHLALEIDYIPGLSTDIKKFKKKYSLDYTIGGIHLVKAPHSEKLWFIDGSPEGYDVGLIEVFEMDICKAVGCYFTQLWEMITEQKPDIIAHFDKIKMNNRGLYFSTDENWYRNYIHETIRIIAYSGQIVEVNTRGIYKKRSEELYPSIWILEELLKLNVPVIVSTDAHKPEELSLQMPETLQILKDIGYRETMVLTSKGWKGRAL
jgi:histidinol-phosphatase (PHP family)